MAIASQQTNAHAPPISAVDAFQKAAVVSSALDEILAKVSAQRNRYLLPEEIIDAPSAASERVTVAAATAKTVETAVETTTNSAIEPAAERIVKPDIAPVVDAASEALLNVQQMAAEGHFQAISYWLNERLVADSLYAQVLADEVPGRLRVLVEFERAPEPRRLVRFVCDRLYRLNSDIIEGVHLVVRPLGSGKTDWEKTIRIPTATERAQRQVHKAEDPIQLAHESEASQLTRRAVKSQFNFLRAMLICGSAIAALVFGGFSALILSNRLASVAVAPEDAIAPWFEEVPDEFSQATSVSFRPASRFQGRTVEAALETVAVVPHRDVAEPNNPTVTLLFGGELSLNNFVFEDTSDIDHLFSDIEVYQQADVAMLGLAEPLANASTTLQENFHHRTRPQAVQTLKAGGIDIVSLADEGTMTYGARGLAETLNNLDRQGIYRVGAGRDQREAHRPEILEVKGQRIAYLGYNPDAIKGAKAEKAGVAAVSSEDRQHIAEDIQAIRSQVDWVVVNYRWGDLGDRSAESLQADAKNKLADSSAPDFTTAAPKDWQKSLAHEAVDAGADLVVGYHPDFVQGAEIYRDRPIAYSLGDFAFNSDPLQDHDTAALKVSLRNQQMKVEFLPVTTRDSKLQMAAKEHATAILQSIRSASKTLEQPLPFPTVIKAEPIYTEPVYTEPTYPEPAYPEPAYPELAPPPASSEPASDDEVAVPDPLMRESEALFMPEAEAIEGDPSRFLEDTQSSLNDLTEADVLSWEEPFNEEPFSKNFSNMDAAITPLSDAFSNEPVDFRLSP